MTLKLHRLPTNTRQVTHGVLTLQLADGAIEQMYTLEDAVREIPNRPVQEWKVYGQTAIPAGTYRVELTLSARFKTVLPLLVNVPGFSGIRIHAGNVIDDTEGCILVGLQRFPSSIGRSRDAMRTLLRLLQTEPGPHTITVRNA